MHLAVDIETTGLSADDDAILEIAAVLVNNDIEVIDSWTGYVEDDTEQFVSAVYRCRHGDDQYVNKMHTDSGLWDAWKGADRFSARRASNAIIDMMKRHGVEPKTVPLLGNSVGSLDRPFIQKQMPTLNTYLSHRNLDISSIRLMLDARAPHIQAAWENETLKRDNTTHRALDDIELCLDQYRFYCGALGL